MFHDKKGMPYYGSWDKVCEHCGLSYWDIREADIALKEGEKRAKEIRKKRKEVERLRGLAFSVDHYPKEPEEGKTEREWKPEPVWQQMLYEKQGDNIERMLLEYEQGWVHLNVVKAEIFRLVYEYQARYENML